MLPSHRVQPLRVGVVAVALAFASGAAAQPFPWKPVRLVLPFSAGGTTDVPARILSQKLSEAFGQQVIVDNRPGAGSTIGTDFVAKSKPDGYTILFASTTHVISPHLYKSVPYNHLADFAPIMRFSSGPYVLVVHPSLPAKNVREFIALAKANPGKIDYASSGNGSSQHLVGALFAMMAGIELNHVPYKGSGPATQDLIGGQVKVGFPGPPIAIPHIKAGRLRALGVTTPKRSDELPDVPTIAEAGLPGYEATIWLGLFAPAGTPREIVMRFYTEVSKALGAQDVKANIAATGVDVSILGPEEFGAYVKSEDAKWSKVVRESGATVN